jgi:hypothetical protein
MIVPTWPLAFVEAIQQNIRIAIAYFNVGKDDNSG